MPCPYICIVSGSLEQMLQAFLLERMLQLTHEE